MEIKDTKIQVFGAKGFIGQHLIKKLEGYGAIVLYQPTSMYDISKPEEVKECIELHKPDIIINLAAQLAKQLKYLEDTYNPNIAGTFNVLNEGFKNDVKKVILIGSSEEENIYSFYGLSKKITKQLGNFYNDNTNMSVVTLIPSIVYGPGQKNDMFIPSMMKSYIKGEEFNMSSGIQMRNFIYIDDFIEAIISSIFKECKTQPIYIMNDKSYQIKNVANTFKQITEGDFNFFANSIGMRAGEQIGFLNHNSAKASLGWEPQTSLEEGLKKTLDYWKSLNISDNNKI